MRSFTDNCHNTFSFIRRSHSLLGREKKRPLNRLRSTERQVFRMEGQPLEKKQRLEENAAPKDCDPTLLRADLQNVTTEKVEENVAKKDCRPTPLEADWQNGKSVVLCLQTLFDEQLWTDVSFTFPEEDDVEDINAHRLILASRSPVFQAMFYGPLADTSNKIEIKSISKQAFEDVLRFVYTDRLGVDIDVDRLLEAMSGGHRYRIDSLLKHCCECLKTKISVDTIFTILESAFLFEQWELVYACTHFIDQNAEVVLELESFLNVSQPVLQLLLEGDTLLISEKDLVTRVEKWAEHKCLQQDLGALTENMQRILGGALNCLRFTSVGHRVFEYFMSNTKLLKQPERDNILSFYRKNVKCGHFAIPTQTRMPTSVSYIIAIQNQNGGMKSCVIETFSIEPKYTFIFGRFKIKPMITEGRALSYWGQKANNERCVCFALTLTCEDFEFNTEVKGTPDCDIDVKIDEKLLLISGHTYKFSLKLTCIHHLHYCENCESGSTCEFPSFKISTEGHQVLHSIEVQHLSGRRAVSHWELKNCVELPRRSLDDDMDKAKT
ncbi:hypothetical protein ScPMuIL_007491 [Solemya velum]